MQNVLSLYENVTFTLDKVFSLWSHLGGSLKKIVLETDVFKMHPRWLEDGSSWVIMVLILDHLILL